MPKNNKRSKKQKESRKKLIKTTKKIARNAVSSVASQYIGAENVKMSRVAINAIGRSLKPKMTTLSACASRLLKAYADPFSVENVCLPIPPAVPTVKLRVFLRGIAFIGTGGFGYVAVAPTLCHDRPCILATTVEYASANISSVVNNLSFAAQNAGGANYPALVYLQTGVSHGQLNNNTGVDPLSPSVEGRICSACLSVQYSGKAVDQQGLIVGWNDFTSVSVVGDAHASTAPGNGYSIANLMSQPSADVEMNKGKMCLPIFPSDTRPLDFPDFAGASDKHAFPYSEEITYVDVAGLKTGAPVAVIAFTGTPNSSVYYEYVQHIEFKGTLFPANRYTQSDVDFVGYTIVSDMLQKARYTASSTNGRSFQACLNEEMRKHGIRYGSEYRTV